MDIKDKFGRTLAKVFLYFALMTIFVGILGMSLAGCDQEPRRDPKAEEVKLFFPDEMKDCKAFHVPNEQRYTYLVVRCPHSDTSVQYGKNGHTLTIEK